MSKIDLDFFEPILLHNCLRATDTSYISSVVDYLDPTHFTDSNIGSVVKIVCDYYIQRNSPPSLTEIKARLTTPTLKEAFKQSVGRIASISKDPIDQFELIENTEIWLRERIMRACIAKIADDQVKGKLVDQSAVFAQMDLAQSISLIDGIGMDYLKDIDAHCQRLLDSSEYISTGWTWLDKMLGGGFMKFGRALYMFCGVTNVGKSIFLGNIAVNALKQGKKVVLITLEMSEDIYGKRIDSQITQIPLSALGNNTANIASGVKEFAANTPDAQLIIKEFPPSSVTVRQIDAYLQKLVRKGIKIDLIVLDYLNLVAPQKTSGSSYDDIKKIAEHLRALTYKYAASVVSATQLNRCLDIASIVTKEDSTECRIDSIIVGDKILGSENQFVTVNKVFPIEHKPCYRITTKSGKSIICSREHMHPTSTGQDLSINSGLSVGTRLIVVDE